MARGSGPFLFPKNNPLPRASGTTKHKNAMKNKLATIGFVVLATLGLRAQHTALQFDGVDDFAFVTVNNPPATVNAENFTFEAIFKTMPNGHDMVILAAPQAKGDLLFGIAKNGNAFTSYRGSVYFDEGPYLADGECHHMAITYSGRDIKFYVDGQFTYQLALNAPISFTNQTNMYLGMNYPDQSTAFEGVLDEVRLWPEARTDIDIATWAFLSPTSTQLPRYLLLPFLEGFGNATIDPLALGLNYAHWNAEISMPIWTESCIFENNLFERIGVNPPPPCLPVNPNNYICNGEFEQFDPILLTSTTPHPSNAFIPDALGNTDITNWYHVNSSPDMYVRNGIGNIPSLYWNGSPNTWDWPTNTSNNAMIGMYNGNGVQTFLDNEAIKTNLTAPLSQGVSYEFSAWVYNKNLLGDNSYNNLKVTLYSSSTGSALSTLPSQVIPLNSTVSTNNGWHFVSFIFTVPFGPWGNSLDELMINYDMSSSAVRTLCYTYLDDLSLVEYQFPSDNCPNCFQAHIGSGVDNDSFHRRLAVDASNNIYITGKVSNDSPTGLNFGFATGAPNLHSLAGNTVSSYIAKYSSTGTLLWSKHYPEAEINDIEVLPNGNLFVTGTTTLASGAAPNVTFVNPFTPISILAPWGSNVIITPQIGPQLLFGQVNTANGAAVLQAHGGSGYEIGVDATVAGNKVYIACATGPQGYTFYDPNSPVTFTPISHSGLVGFTNTPRTVNIVLEYDWSTNARDAFDNYNPGELQMLATNGTDLFVLTQDELHKLTTTNLQLSGTGTALNINNGQGQFARDLVVTPSNEVYVSFSQEQLRKYNGANMQLLQSASVKYYALGGNNTDLFGLALSPNKLFISKLDVSPNATLGQVIWTKEITANNAFFPDFHSAGDLTASDIIPLGSSSKVAYVANFENTATPWQINFGTKSLAAAVNLAHGNTFVGTIEDLGNSGQFKTQEPLSISAVKNGITLRPNPARDWVQVECESDIKEYHVFNSIGELIRSEKIELIKSIVLDVSQFSKGVYFIEVEAGNGTFVEKLIVE